MSIGELDTDRLAALDGELRRQHLAEANRTGRDKANALEQMWRESEEHHTERRRRENAALWYEFHANQADLFRDLAQEHEAKAAALLEAGEAV